MRDYSAKIVMPASDIVKQQLNVQEYIPRFAEGGNTSDLQLRDLGSCVYSKLYQYSPKPALLFGRRGNGCDLDIYITYNTGDSDMDITSIRMYQPRQ